MVVKSTLVAAVASALIFAACSPKAGESVILEVRTSKVTLKEFEDFYSKNSVDGDTLSKTCCYHVRTGNGTVRLYSI